MTPEQLAEIKAADLHSLQGDAQHNPDVWTLNEWRKQLLAEVERLREELGQLRLDDEIEQRATALSPSDFDEPF